MSSCADAYAAADKGEAQNVVLSDEAVASMCRRSARRATPLLITTATAICRIPRRSPLSARPSAPETTRRPDISSSIRDGLVHEEVLIYRSGAASVVTVSMQWDDKTRSGDILLRTVRP